MNQKVMRLYIILSCFFITNVILAEMIGTKIFSLEKTFHLKPIAFVILNETLSFNLTAGVLLWPFVFVMTDIINEYFGKKGVKLLSYMASILILYAFGMIYLAMGVSPADFWISTTYDNQIVNRDIAFNVIFGQGMWIIAGSIIAFLIGQVVDVAVFQWLRKKTGNRMIWLRSTGSTLVSQLVDSFVVLFVAFYLSGQFTLIQVLSIGLLNYIYKFFMAVLMTPLIYLVHGAVDKYLGKRISEKLTKNAAERI